MEIKNIFAKKHEQTAKKRAGKKFMIVFLVTKIPIIIYLIYLLLTVPEIDAVDYEHILGAHRGNSIDYPENTYDAFKSAVDNEKYIFIEFDIQYTKDSKIITFHDTTLLRMEKKADKITNLTYKELQEKTDLEVPLYEDIMDLISDTKKIDIEIKSQGNLEEDQKLVDFVVKDCIERGILENVMISSISSDVISYVSETYPDIKTGKIYWIHTSTYAPFDFLTNDLYEEMEESGADYLMLHGSNLHNIDDLVRLKPEDKTICIWYFTDEMYILQVDENDGMW